MSQLQLKELAHKILIDDRMPFNHLAKILARSIMTYFDPEYFSIPKSEREKQILKRTRPWEM